MDDVLSFFVALVVLFLIIFVVIVSTTNNRKNSNQVLVSKQFLINHKLAYYHPNTGEFILLEEVTNYE